LEERTREPARRAIEELRARAGDEAATPENFAFHAAGGGLAQEKDPYFQFDDAVERWVKSFAALGIGFRDAKITLDLLDRKGKYENGFMHGMVPAFRRRGGWLPAEINFTANALPGSVGAGVRAAQTLFHEGGHAAHFANILMDAPCFSQEFAPTSVALAETQSMFCDSFLSDADWMTRYARNAAGEPMPFDLIEREIRETQPFAAHAVRSMLIVCYAEKALYEMPEDELTPDHILATLRSVEERFLMFPGGCPRPTLAVPHLLSREASAYYHGYVLAQMAVHQTRDHFREKYGYLLDNPAIGKDLADVYWAPGNSRSFLDLVKELTGKPFSADAIAAHVSRSADSAVADARRQVDKLADIPEFRGDVDLDLRLGVIHGAETIVDSGNDALRGAEAFRDWVRERWPRAGAGVSA
ncbi:MAG: peptidase M3, partial [Gemmatimonadetes bacterium]|nr:peptidase M3 [Gemmatimonadota bacterium]